MGKAQTKMMYTFVHTRERKENSFGGGASEVRKVREVRAINRQPFPPTPRGPRASSTMVSAPPMTVEHLDIFFTSSQYLHKLCDWELKKLLWKHPSQDHVIYKYKDSADFTNFLSRCDPHTAAMFFPPILHVDGMLPSSYVDFRQWYEHRVETEARDTDARWSQSKPEEKEEYVSEWTKALAEVSRRHEGASARYGNVWTTLRPDVEVWNF